MFEIAGDVLDWLDEGRAVMTARILDTAGFSSWDPGAAIAWTAGRPPAGSLFGGAADSAVVSALSETSAGASAGASAETSAGTSAETSAGTSAGTSIVTVTVTAEQAADAGLACGGTARIVLQDAAELSREQWSALRDRRPRCLVTDLGQDGTTAVYGPQAANSADVDPLVRRLFARGASRTTEIDTDGTRCLITALWPTPTLVIVGDGLLAEALQTLVGLLEWRCLISNDGAEGERLTAALGAGDGAIVLSHDLAVAGPALHGALAGDASYVGALGSRRTQAARADWLTERGVAAERIATVHGPAGLDIGALTPYEIAVSIVAELLAVRTGNDARSLRGRQSSIHPSGVQAPPPRYPVA